MVRAQVNAAVIRYLAQIYAQREEICRAFIAKHGIDPDEVEQVIMHDKNGNTHWFLRKRLEDGNNKKA